MKLIEITFSYDEGWQRECTRNGVIKTSRKLISMDKIVSIAGWKGTLLHEGRSGTEVKTIDGKSHVDDRSYEEFIEYIELNDVHIIKEDPIDLKRVYNGVHNTNY